MLPLDMNATPRAIIGPSIYPEKLWLTDTIPRLLLKLAGKGLTPRKIQLLEIASGRSIEAFKRSGQAHGPVLCELIREIVNNPFRPAAFDPTWLTSTVIAMARQMDETEDFSATPILADALQDAGCNDERILNHCRGHGSHVRGGAGSSVHTWKRSKHTCRMIGHPNL